MDCISENTNSSDMDSDCVSLTEENVRFNARVSVLGGPSPGSARHMIVKPYEERYFCRVEKWLNGLDGVDFKQVIHEGKAPVWDSDIDSSSNGPESPSILQADMELILQDRDCVDDDDVDEEEDIECD